MRIGLEVFLQNETLLRRLKGQRVGVVCHPASVDGELHHTLDLLAKRLNVTCAFGPQHGVRGDKQDNMIESDDFVDPVHNIPVFSLYGRVRKPTDEMLEHIDVLIFDLQDLGCRIYTFITTLLNVISECARLGKSVVVLDRPNPAGRPVEGFRLLPGWESFVGAVPLPMRHGLTVGELAQYFKSHFRLDLEVILVRMKGYQPDKAPGMGWPQRPWVNPSPNAASLNMARAYAGTVLLEGTTLSEGRGTTKPLEMIGAPDVDFHLVLEEMHHLAPTWLKGCVLRECFFEPTFHKHRAELCHGFQIHTDVPAYAHSHFRPFRIIALTLKTIRMIYPNYPIYRDFTYEYEIGKLPLDVINGSPRLREWIEDRSATCIELDADLKKDEESWLQERKEYLLY